MMSREREREREREKGMKNVRKKQICKERRAREITKTIRL
jgi:hypothetical protein